MANGFYMAQAPQLDYRALIQTAGAPLGGFLGGIQQGQEMRRQQAALRAAEAEQEALEQEATAAEERQALAMQALESPEAFERYAAVDPQGALKMQQAVDLQRQAQVDQEQREREEAGRMGTLLANVTSKNAMSVLNRAITRVRNENDDETEIGLPTREEAAKMKPEELVAQLKQVGSTMEQIAMGPEAAAQQRMRRQEAAEKRQARLAKAAEEGDVKALPAIKDPSAGRKEFTGLSKDFRTQATAYNRIQAAAKDPSAAGDLALIFNYMKVLDPGSTVREGEFATAQNAAGVPERVRAQLNRVVSGERLTQPIRDDFVKQSRNLIEPAIEGQIRREDTFRKLATKSKFDPEDVVIDFLGDLRPTGKKGGKAGMTPEEAEARAPDEEVTPQDLTKLTDDELINYYQSTL